MTLDEATRRNLELTQTIRTGNKKGSLLDVLDATRTPMGSRLLRRWLHQPLLDLDKLTKRDWTASSPGTTTCLPAPSCAPFCARSATWSAGPTARRRALPGQQDLVGIRQALELLPDIGTIAEPPDN